MILFRLLKLSVCIVTIEENREADKVLTETSEWNSHKVSFVFLVAQRMGI